MKTEPNTTELTIALDACLEIMTRAIGEKLPVKQGTACEEEDWLTAIRKARNALCGEIFNATIYRGKKNHRVVINKNGRTLVIQLIGKNVREELTRHLIENSWVANDDAHRIRFHLNIGYTREK